MFTLNTVYLPIKKICLYFSADFQVTVYTTYDEKPIQIKVRLGF